MSQDGVMTDPTCDPTAMQVPPRVAANTQGLTWKVTTVRRDNDTNPTGEAGAFAALDRLYTENSEALRRLADG